MCIYVQYICVCDCGLHTHLNIKCIYTYQVFTYTYYVCFDTFICLYVKIYSMSCSLLCLRRKESILVTLAAMARAITSAFLLVSPGMVTLLMFSTFAVTTGQPLSPAIVFTSISLLSNLRVTSIMLMLRAILGLQEGRVAFQRIEVLYVQYCFVASFCTFSATFQVVFHIFLLNIILATSLF